MSVAMSDLALQIIWLSEEEQAHIQAVTDLLATDPGLRSRLAAAERAGVSDGLPPLFRTGLTWARLVREGGAPLELQRAVAFKDVTGAAAEEIITRRGWPFRSVIGESVAFHLSALVAHGGSPSLRPHLRPDLRSSQGTAAVRVIDRAQRRGGDRDMASTRSAPARRPATRHRTSFAH